MNSNKLMRNVVIAMGLGIAVGIGCNWYVAGDAELAKKIAGYFGILTTVFLNMIKMVIAPLVFATLVAGISSMTDTKAIGRIGTRALIWFIGASFISLILGMFFVHIFDPGHGLNWTVDATHSAAAAAPKLATESLNLKDFITHVFPKSFFDAMAKNEILQILVFSLFFGVALAALKIRDKSAQALSSVIEELVHIMLKITDYVMVFAPMGVFAAIASALTTQGLPVLLVFAKFIGAFVVGLLSLWIILVALGYVFLGKAVFTLIREIRSPMALAFATASSEAAYPKLMEALERFGVKDKITGFVLPLGYSFNLDGSMMYMSFVALFLAQAYNIDLSVGTQIMLLLVLMVSSKGVAGVPRASLVVVAAVLPMFGIPEAGLMLIFGIDQFLDMCRTATNVLGNSIATAVVAKWEGEIGEPQVREEEEGTPSAS